MAVSHAPAPADYGLQGPTPATVIAALAEHMPVAEAAAEWRRACEAAGVPEAPQTAAQLLDAISVLADRPGVTGICGMAIKIRARAALRLARSPHATSPSGGR